MQKQLAMTPLHFSEEDYPNIKQEEMAHWPS